MNINNLVQKITTAATAYYLGEQPIMSDQEFDELVERLRKEDPSNPILTQVGWGIRVYGKKVPLPEPIRHSLPKVFTIDEIKKQVVSEGPVFISPKIDGMSVILQYDDNGNLKLAVTRGDGVNGIDITHKMNFIGNQVLKGIPNSIIRGELYISMTDFAGISDLYANPRNAVSGIINSKSLDNINYVRFVQHDGPWDVLLSKDIIYVPVHMYSVCRLRVEDLDDVAAAAREHYPIDGVVINGDVAFKFPTEEAMAVVAEVEWNASPRGQIVPVVRLDRPIRLYGTMVERMSGFHAQYIEDNQIGPGTVIMVTKANEIIPYITKVVTPTVATIPKELNGRELVRRGVGLWFVMSEDDRLRLAMYNFVKTYFTTDGVADAHKIIEDAEWRDFYDLECEMQGTLSRKLSLKQGWGLGKIAKLVPLFDWNRKLNGNYFFSSLGIHGIGDTHAKTLARFLPYCLMPLPDDLIEVVQDKVPVNVIRGLRENWKVIHLAYTKFRDRIEVPTEEKKKLSDWNVVLTGRFSVSKSVIEKALNDAGISVADSINSSTKYLMQADKNSTSSKTQTAQKKGIEILDEAGAKNLWNLIW